MKVEIKNWIALARCCKCSQFTFIIGLSQLCMHECTPVLSINIRLVCSSDSSMKICSNLYQSVLANFCVELRSIPIYHPHFSTSTLYESKCSNWSISPTKVRLMLAGYIPGRSLATVYAHTLALTKILGYHSYNLQAWSIRYVDLILLRSVQISTDLRFLCPKNAVCNLNKSAEGFVGRY
jgi:hypothetical protein